LSEGVGDGFRSILDQHLREGPLNEAAIRIALATAITVSIPDSRMTPEAPHPKLARRKADLLT
jgi:hypothetical protein